ncbi:hypothetical protein GAY28_05295 [Azospirillum brasilense]|nr:hypothetical protein [Azospirillum brasilense]
MTTTMNHDEIEALHCALESLFAIKPTEEGVLVFTHCVYPSRIQVRVRVEGLGNGRFLVSDDALGLGEVLSMGPETQKPGYYIAEQAGRYGLLYRRGAVVVEVDSPAKVPGAIMLVANASKDGVLRTSLVYEARDVASFDYHFDRFVRERYRDKFRPGVISGASGVQRKFRYIHQRGNVSDIRLDEPILLVEPVMPGQMSIAVKTQAHREVTRRKLPGFWQCLGVDRDIDQWTKGDIALLEQSDLRWMDFNQLETQLPRLVA